MSNKKIWHRDLKCNSNTTVYGSVDVMLKRGHPVDEVVATVWDRENAQFFMSAPDLFKCIDPEALEAIADQLTEYKHSARAHSLRVIANSLRLIAKTQRAAIEKATREIP